MAGGIPAIPCRKFAAIAVYFDASSYVPVMAGISTQPVRLKIYAWRSHVRATMATTNQKVAAAARMAVHTMIRANG